MTAPHSHLNGYPVIAFDRHSRDYHTVMVDRGHLQPQRYVVATWWPALGDAWQWGHYCDDMAQANETMFAVSARNHSRS